jgi:capsular polysaccharide biosynthesis protein
LQRHNIKVVVIVAVVLIAVGTAIALFVTRPALSYRRDDVDRADLLRRLNS